MPVNPYHQGIQLQDYWVSEKYDGVRGFWEGDQLLTRDGEKIAAPAWFTAGRPNAALDSERWAGRGQFSKAVSTMRQQNAGLTTHTDWRGMRFMVFDLPAHDGPFTDRIAPLQKIAGDIGRPWILAVTQTRIASHAALHAMLQKTVKLSGEGLLHCGGAPYKGLRNNDLPKGKTHEDAEARVVGHIPGKDKYAGQLRALRVELSAVPGQPARRFKLHTGFSDAQRHDPPAVAALVTYRFRGLSDSGIPRFASFMRVQTAEVS